MLTRSLTYKCKENHSSPIRREERKARFGMPASKRGVGIRTPQVWRQQSPPGQMNRAYSSDGAAANTH